MSEVLGGMSTIAGGMSSGAALSVPVSVVVVVLGVYDTLLPPPPHVTACTTALTMIVRVAVDRLPVASTFVYDIVYVPSTPVSTDPVD
jgi:hypothetical protein